MKMRASTSIFLLPLLACCTTIWAQFGYNEDRNWISGISFCGCQDCNKAAYNQIAGGHSCRDRVENLIFQQGMTEEAACAYVANTESLCGPACDPNRCDGRDVPPPIPVLEQIEKPHCDCQSCTPEVWNRPVGWDGYTCGARIEYMQNVKGLDREAACYEVAGLQFPLDSACAPCNPKKCGIQAAPEMRPAIATEPIQPIAALPVSVNVPNTRCGCSRCTENILSAMAGKHSCSARIDYLLNNLPHLYPKEEQACRKVAGEFPDACGAPQCDPDRCHGSSNTFEAYSTGNSAGNTPNPPSRGVSRDMNLYCFPPSIERQTYDGVWGKYAIQVKSDAEGKCGPSDNIFSTQTVALANNGRDLKLQFKKVDNQWHGSEVRILLPQAETFHGSYTFSVKSVQVLDSQTGSLVSTVLPPSLILGLFTWNPLEEYAIHENMNHEVDVEISRWNDPDNADGQFLVQPPGDPQTHRFFTGSDGKSYQQAPRVYGFDWRPTEVEWFSNAGGGQHFTYSTQDALNAGKVDYNQCMPSDVEVRINLWNLFGSSPNPPEMADTHVVEVLIDRFQFEPSGLAAAPDGHVCSKDCHCAPTSRCIQNRCTAIARNGGTGRRMQSDRIELLGQDPSASVPVVLLLMLANLVLIVIVVRRHWSSREAGGGLPSVPEGINDHGISQEKTLAVQRAVVL